VVLTSDHAFIGCVSVAFSPDGKYLVGGFGDGEMVLWEVGRLKEVAVRKAHSPIVRDLHFAPDGKTLISVGHDKMIRVWDVASREPKERAELRQHTGAVWCLALSPNGNVLASGSCDATVRLWDLRLNPPRETGTIGFSSGVDWPCSLCIDRTGRTLAIATGKKIALWDISEEKPKEKNSTAGHPEAVWRVCFARDGKTLASCGQDKSVRLWEFDGESLNNLAELHGHASSGLYGLDFSPDSKTLVSADEDGRVIVWEVDQRLERHRWQLPNGLHCAVFAPDGRHVALGAGSQNVVYIMRLPE
jgi:WD40 repeat protein